jgi:uncharacterized membrane protein
MAKAQQAHRQSLEFRELEARTEYQKEELALLKRGQIFALCIGTLALTLGFVLACLGHQYPACFIGGAGVIGLVTAFLRIQKQAKIAETEKRGARSEMAQAGG